MKMPAKDFLTELKLPLLKPASLHEVPRFNLGLALPRDPKSGWSEPLLVSLPQTQTNPTLVQNTEARGIGWISNVGKYSGFFSLISGTHSLLSRTGAVGGWGLQGKHWK